MPVLIQALLDIITLELLKETKYFGEVLDYKLSRKRNAEIRIQMKWHISIMNKVQRLSCHSITGAIKCTTQASLEIIQDIPLFMFSSRISLFRSTSEKVGRIEA